MEQITRRVAELTGCRPDNLPLDDLLAANEPRVLRGLAADWAVTRAGKKSDRDAMDYVRSFYNGRPISASIGDPAICGRLFYNDDLTSLNFQVQRAQLDAVIERIARHLADEQPPTIYIGSTLVDLVLPGFRKDNDVIRGTRRRSTAVDMDRQPHDRVLSLRRSQQSRVLRRRPASLHAVSARADLQSLPRPGFIESTANSVWA